MMKTSVSKPVGPKGNLGLRLAVKCSVISYIFWKTLSGENPDSTFCYYGGPMAADIVMPN